jgi:hypothetical protein
MTFFSFHGFFLHLRKGKGRGSRECLFLFLLRGQKTFRWLVKQRSQSGFAVVVTLSSVVFFQRTLSVSPRSWRPRGYMYVFVCFR